MYFLAAASVCSNAPEAADRLDVRRLWTLSALVIAMESYDDISYDVLIGGACRFPANAVKLCAAFGSKTARLHAGTANCRRALLRRAGALEGAKDGTAATKSRQRWTTGRPTEARPTDPATRTGRSAARRTTTEARTTDSATRTRRSARRTAEARTTGRSEPLACIAAQQASARRTPSPAVNRRGFLILFVVFPGERVRTAHYVGRQAEHV